MTLATTATVAIAAALSAAAGLATLPAAPVAAAAAPTAPAADVENFAIDASHSAVIYRIKHLGAAFNYGRFNEMDGSFTLADNALTFDITIKTESVDSANQKRDDHLRSPDFFNTRQFPTATFKSTSSSVTEQENQYGHKTFAVTGDFTLNGTTKTITVPVEVTGAGSDPWGGYRAGIETVFTISRSEFGITYMPGGLGDDVRLIVSLEGIRQ